MKLSNINTTDITDAIRLGCRMMSNVFNADDNDIPFFGSEVRPNPQLLFSGVHSESHVPGRHLNALLNAEDAGGISVDPDAIKKHANAAFFSYSRSVALPLNRTEIGRSANSFTTHNVREGFHALYSLVKYRNSDRARKIAENSIRDIFELFKPDSGWDFNRLENEHGIEVRENTFITGIARSIGPLVKYYRATGYGPALELAVILKEKTTREFFLESGAYDRESFGSHTHSTTCVMSSLAQLADLLDDARLLNRVKSFYDNGLWEIRDEIGWVIENSGDDASPDRGEINNTGDIVETALILGRKGYTEYFEDAERITRCHILPSQLRDKQFHQRPAQSAQHRRTSPGRRPTSRRLWLPRTLWSRAPRLRANQLQHGYRRRGRRLTLRSPARSRTHRILDPPGESPFRSRNRTYQSRVTLHK